MRNEDEDLLHGNDEDQPSSAWWSPSSLLTPDVTSITAFTIALTSISTFGIGSTMLVAQSVLGAPAGPSDLRALNLTGAVILLGMGARRDPARLQGFPAGRAVVPGMGPAPGRRGCRRRGAKHGAEHRGTHRSAALPRARRRPALTPSSLPT